MTCMQVAWLWVPETRQFVLVYLLEDGTVVPMGTQDHGVQEA